MFENPRRGRQAKNFTTNVPKILDLNSEQIFSKNWRWVPLNSGKNYHLPNANKIACELAVYSGKNESTSWKKTRQTFQDTALHQATLSWLLQLHEFFWELVPFAGYVMTYYLAETAGHKLRTLTHERDLPVVIKLTCGSVAGAVAQTGDSYRVPPLSLLIYFY